MSGIVSSSSMALSFCFCLLASLLFIQPSNALPARGLDISALPKPALVQVLDNLDIESLYSLVKAGGSSLELVREHFTYLKSVDRLEEIRQSVQESLGRGYSKLARTLLTGNRIDLHESIHVEKACESGDYDSVELFYGRNTSLIDLPFSDTDHLKFDCWRTAASRNFSQIIELLSYEFRGNSLGLVEGVVEAVRNDHYTLLGQFRALSGSSLVLNQINRLVYHLAACKGDLFLLQATEKELNMQEFSLLNFEAINPSLRSDPLSCACANGHTNIVQHFVHLSEGEVNVDLAVIANSPLARAIEKNHWDIVEILLESQEVLDKLELAPMVSAMAKAGNASFVPRMYDLLGDKVSEYNPELPPLFGLAANIPTYLELVEITEPDYISSGADIPLAAKSGKMELLEFLVQEASKPIHDDIILDAVREATLSGNEDALELLLKHVCIEAYPESYPEIIMPPMFLAAADGHLGALKMLLSHLAQNLEMDAEGYLGLFITASNYGRLEIMQYLMDFDLAQIDPSALNNMALIKAAGQSSLEPINYIVSLSDKYPEIDPAARKNRVFTMAVLADNLEMIKYLLSLKSRFPMINPADNDNKAIRTAKKLGKFHLVRFFLSLPEDFGIDRSVAPYPDAQGSIEYDDDTMVDEESEEALSSDDEDEEINAVYFL